MDRDRKIVRDFARQIGWKLCSNCAGTGREGENRCDVCGGLGMYSCKARPSITTLTAACKALARDMAGNLIEDVPEDREPTPVGDWRDYLDAIARPH